MTAVLATIEELEPSALLLPHFGSVEDPREHLSIMRERLTEWASRVREGATVEEFVADAEAELAAGVDDPALANSYRQAAPFWQSHAGLARYWAKSQERATL